MTSRILNSQNISKELRTYRIDGYNFLTPESAPNSQQREIFHAIDPDGGLNSFPNTALSAGSNVTARFPIPTTTIDECDYFVLGFNLTNGGTATVNIVDSYSLLHIVTTNVDGVVKQTLTAKGMKNNMLLANDNGKLSSYLQYMGISASNYASSNAIAAGTTVSRYVIFRPLISTNKMPLWFEKPALAINATFRSGNRLLTSAGGDISNITLTSLQLIMLGHVLPPDVRLQKHYNIIASPVDYRYLDTETIITNFGVVVSGTDITRNITSNGFLSYALFDLNENGATGTALSDDSKLITSFDVMRSGDAGANKIGVGKLTTAFLNGIAAQKYWNNTQLLRDRNVYPWVYGENPLYDREWGSNNGSLKLTGPFNIRITPGANLTNADLIITAFYHAELRIDYARGFVDSANSTLRPV